MSNSTKMQIASYCQRTCALSLQHFAATHPG